MKKSDLFLFWWDLIVIEGCFVFVFCWRKDAPFPDINYEEEDTISSDFAASLILENIPREEDEFEEEQRFVSPAFFTIISEENKKAN